MILYIPVSCIYLVWIIWHVKELRKIRENPRIYDKISGYEEYQRSEWYRLMTDSFSRGDSSGASCKGRTLVVYMALLFLLNTTTDFLGATLLSKGQNNVLFFYGLDDGAYVFVQYENPLVDIDACCFTVFICDENGIGYCRIWLFYCEGEPIEKEFYPIFPVIPHWYLFVEYLE